MQMTHSFKAQRRTPTFPATLAPERPSAWATGPRLVLTGDAPAPAEPSGAGPAVALAPDHLPGPTGMPAIALTEVLFELGQLSRDTQLGNQALLERLAEIFRVACGVDAVSAVVHEHGLGEAAGAAAVSGPWAAEEAKRFIEHNGWQGCDRVLLSRLATRERGRVVRRSELIDERDFRGSRMFAECHRPLRLGDQALAVCGREDGAEIVLSVHAVEGQGPLSADQIARAADILPFIARAWSAAWRRQPAWVAGLRAQSREILDLVLSGLDDDQIAKRTGLTYHSVRAHLKRLFREAGVRSRLHLMQSCRGETPSRARDGSRQSAAAEN
ncbi:MAG: helix-turn-helix transcriptional regulator [Phycisphaerales bacterium]|nr:helix-turn-helix transcriptional regulator [Phycisphaerales bacterium]